MTSTFCSYFNQFSITQPVIKKSLFSDKVSIYWIIYRRYFYDKLGHLLFIEKFIKSKLWFIISVKSFINVKYLNLKFHFINTTGWPSTIYLMLSFPTLCYDVTIQGYSIWCSPILLSKQPIKVKHMHYQNYWNMGILNTMIDQCEQNLVECWTICWEDTPLQTFLLLRYQSWAPTYCAILYW